MRSSALAGPGPGEGVAVAAVAEAARLETIRFRRGLGCEPCPSGLVAAGAAASLVLLLEVVLPKAA